MLQDHYLKRILLQEHIANRGGGGGHSNILEYTCVNKKTREKRSFFVVECVKQGMCAGSKM